jgi:hypothetical protein
MPVILKPPAYESWLDPSNQNVVELGKMLKNEIVTESVSNPVSKQVNSTQRTAPMQNQSKAPSVPMLLISANCADGLAFNLKMLFDNLRGRVV